MSHVHDCQQHHAANDGKQHQAAGSRLAHAITEVADGARAASMIVGRVGGSQSTGCRGNLIVGLRNRSAWRQTAQHVEPTKSF